MKDKLTHSMCCLKNNQRKCCPGENPARASQHANSLKFSVHQKDWGKIRFSTNVCHRNRRRAGSCLGISFAMLLARAFRSAFREARESQRHHRVACNAIAPNTTKRARRKKNGGGRWMAPTKRSRFRALLSFPSTLKPSYLKSDPRSRRKGRARAKTSFVPY